MCMPVVIDNLDLSGIDPSDPTKRVNPTPELETSGNDSNLGRGTPGAKPTDPAGGGVTPVAGDSGDAPGTREDLWVNAGDWLRGNGTYRPATAVGSATGGPAVAGPNDGPVTTPTGNDTPGPKPGSNVDPSVAAATGPNNDLMTAINNQAAGFKQVADSILAGQQQAADALKSGFLDLTKQQQDALKAADELRKNTGQATRKPSYSLSMTRNSARARAGGIGSTMLSGAGGVPVASLSLGRSSLLGGSAA